VGVCRLVKKSKKKAAKAKSGSSTSINRKNLANVRVIQRNLVYVIGLSLNICKDEVLKRGEYFGKFGKIVKVSVNRSGVYNSTHGGATGSAYVTYVREDDALKCIQAVDGNVLDGKVLRCSFGTTKYCNAFLKNQPCNNPECLYLHDLGNDDDSFTKVL
jgi:CCR4-NOT transcription complex subunit 4